MAPHTQCRYPGRARAGPWALIGLVWGGLAGAVAHAQPQPAEPALHALEVSDDGASLIDRRARLAWSRCVQGMQWDGHACVGTPERLDHGQALASARVRGQADGLRWRLPHVKELQRLVHKTGAWRGLDPVGFPQAPVDWHWAGTASVDTSSVNIYNYGNVMSGRQGPGLNPRTGWAVHLGTGEASGDTPKHTALPVRLVRSWAP